MSIKDYFRDHCIDDTNFFDEGPSLRPNSNFIDGTLTAEIDQFRQGVEITRPEHFGAGTFKIHAGNSGHKLRQNNFGADTKYTNTDYYVEYDNFDPVTYVKFGGNASALRQKTIIGYNEQLGDEYIHNGALEPLAIRSRGVRSQYHPIRQANGAVMSGNESLGGSDEVQTVYINDVNRSTNPFSEIICIETYIKSGTRALVDAMLANPTNQILIPSNDAIINRGLSMTTPFRDIKMQRENLAQTNYETTISAALSLLNPSQDSYVNPALLERSATCGWTHSDATELGTDSVAFGGMTY